MAGIYEIISNFFLLEFENMGLYFNYVSLFCYKVVSIVERWENIIINNYITKATLCHCMPVSTLGPKVELNFFSYLLPCFPHGLVVGPHLLPKLLNTEAVRVYMPNIDRNLIGVQNRKRTVIYQWMNLINGKIYVGSAWNGSVRLLSYWTPSVLNRNLSIYNNLNKYGHNNFMLIILEDLGSTGSVTKNYMLNREQFYLNILFSKYPECRLNNSPTAGNILGFKHTDKFKLNRSGNLNPMHGKIFSTPRPAPGSGARAEFIKMQAPSGRNKAGINKGSATQYGVKKSTSTIAKLIKLIYVPRTRDYETKNLIGEYSTVQCSKYFKMGKDTLTKYLKNGLPYKNKIFSPSPAGLAQGLEKNYNKF